MTQLLIIMAAATALPAIGGLAAALVTSIVKLVVERLDIHTHNQRPVAAAELERLAQAHVASRSWHSMAARRRSSSCSGTPSRPWNSRTRPTPRWCASFSSAICRT